MNKCADCNFWQRRQIFSVESNCDVEWKEATDFNLAMAADLAPKQQDSKFGRCACDKLIYTKAGEAVAENDVAHDGQPEALLYSDADGYRAYLLTGEEFGCIHFCEAIR
jgi:hypothetical protein